MTPRAKAEEIIRKVKIHAYDTGLKMNNTKSLALIVCDEVIEELNTRFIGRRTDYWNDVKKEIQKLLP